MTATARDEQQRRLLDGLRQSLREKGLAQTQIADIVRHARTSRRTFYECFPDKESAFVALIRQGSMAVFARVARIAEADGPLERQIEEAVAAYLQALTDDPVLVAAISRELPVLGRHGAELHREALDRFADLVVRLSHEPRMEAAGLEPLDPDTAVLLIGGIAELVARASLDGRPLLSLAPVVTAATKALILAATAPTTA